MNYKTLALLLAFFPAFAAASDPGTTAANFLKLGVGPRAIGMGEAQVGLADDAYSVYWNPAGLAQLNGREAAFTHNQYFEGIKEEFAAYAQPLSETSAVGGSITYLGIEKFQGYDAVGQAGNQVGANDVSFSGSYAKSFWHDPRLGSLLSVGATVKYLRESLDGVSASAFAVDGGLLYSPGRGWSELLKGWRGGLTIRNLGSSMKFDQESFTLPRSITAGVSYTGQFWGEEVTFAADGQQPNDGHRIFGIGAEVLTLNTLILRAGYTSRSDLGNGLRVGAGIRFKTVQVDYAYAGAGPFGAAHRIGISLRFEPKAPDTQAAGQDWYEKGMRDYKKRRFTDALVNFNKALEMDPTHPQALDMMHKTYDQIKASHVQ